MEENSETGKGSAQETRSFFSSIFLFAFVFGLIALLTSCDLAPADTGYSHPSASGQESLGLGNYGLILVSDNGQRLQAFLPACPNEHLKRDNFSLSRITLREGQRVRLANNVRKVDPSSCMNGQMLEIGCIEEVRSQQGNTCG